MRTLIVEDESYAANRLLSFLSQSKQSFEIVGLCDSITATVNWFEKNESPDLMFLDIQLSDGHSFDIFNEAEIDCPVIFTTAFDKYVLKAFNVNCIDYLLKPFQFKDVEAAILKYKKVQNSWLKQKNGNIADAAELIQKANYKNRFFVKLRDKAYSVTAKQIKYFQYEDEATILYTKDNYKYLIKYSLEELTKLLDPKLFFRINRKQIVQVNFIDRLNTAFKNKLIIEMKDQNEKTDFIVSKHRQHNFRVWLDT